MLALHNWLGKCISLHIPTMVLLEHDVPLSTSNYKIFMLEEKRLYIKFTYILCHICTAELKWAKADCSAVHRDKTHHAILTTNSTRATTFFFFMCHIYSPFRRKRCIPMFWTVSPHSLGSCHFRVTCLPHKGGGVPLSALPKDTTSELAGLFSTTSHKCRAPSREAIDPIF